MPRLAAAWPQGAAQQRQLRVARRQRQRQRPTTQGAELRGARGAWPGASRCQEAQAGDGTNEK